MLILYGLNHEKLEGLVNYKDLKVEKEINIEDTLSFRFPVADPKHDLLQEECYIRTTENEYVIKEVNYSDNEWAEYICKINIEEIKGEPVGHFETIGQTCTNATNLALAGTGWTLASCDVTKLRTVRKNNCTAFDVLKEIQSAYGCEMTFDSVNKEVDIYQSLGSDKGSYFAEQLNLKSLEIQRNSYSFITRLIPIGKDGLGIEAVNGGLNYISNNQYSNKVISSYWEDNRYTSAQDLKDDALIKLAQLSIPFKSYSAEVLDLSSVSAQYSILDYELGDTITLLAASKDTKEKQRIIKLVQYPDEPERNTCEIANKILSLEEMQVRFVESVEVVDTVTTVDGMLDGSKVDALDYNRLNNVSIGTADIQDAAIVEAKIGALAVTNAKIADAAISTAKIQDAAIVTAKIQDAAITNAKIGNAAVDSAQIKDAAIKNAKIDRASVDKLVVQTADIADAAISTAKISVGAIVTALIDTAAVGTAQIADGSITDAKIVELTASKLTAGTIDAADINVINLNASNLTVGTINGQRIGDGTITAQKIAEGAVTTEKIAVGAIVESNIADGAITTNKIAEGAIKESQVNWSTHLLF